MLMWKKYFVCLRNANNDDDDYTGVGIATIAMIFSAFYDSCTN